MVIDQILQTRSTRGDSSFYLYDENLINENIKSFKSIDYSDVSVFFASMANDNQYLLRILKNQGFGLFVNSGKHLQAGLSYGFSPERIIFASTGISEATMRFITDKGIRLNIDSIDQLDLYGRINPGGSVGIRLNIDEKSRNNIFIGVESRIGITLSELEDIFAITDKYMLKIVGTHVYLGTDVTSIEDLITGALKTLELSDLFPDLEYVDMGGGFPLDRDRFDFEEYKKRISACMDSYSNKRCRKIKLILEPGRAMFGNTACFYTMVTDIKERPDRWLICCGASASLLPRAIFYKAYNPVSPVKNKNRKLFDKPVDLVGSTTYSRDFMAKGISLPRVKVGEWLCFKDTGSYCYSMITRFLGQALPPEYLLRCDGTIKKIREGESFLEDSDEF